MQDRPPAPAAARIGAVLDLGLPIVRALAAGAGGTVRLAPSGRGAAFEVVLPAA